MPPAPKLFLIDAHALCYRSYFAIKNLSTSYGQATNAAYGFISTLKKILRQYAPAYMAVCFDVGKKTRRQERYAEYKIHRPAMPDELISQLPLIKDLVLAYRLPIFELEGFEADDVIATIAKRLSKKDLEIIIVSGDKDMLQLLDGSTKVFNIHKDTTIDYEQAKALWGVEPQKIPDYLGLAGDKTDNIPGVAGIGEVTAKDLINEYGSLEDIFKGIDKIKSDKIREKLQGQREQAFFSKELAVLDTDVPIEFDLPKLKVCQPDNKRLFELFKKLEFRKLAEEIAQDFEEKPPSAVKSIRTAIEAQALAAKIEKKGGFVFLFNRSQGSDNFWSDDFVVVLSDEEAFEVSSQHMSHFKKVFADPLITKISHDIKEAMKILFKKDIAIGGKPFDVMLAGYLLVPSQGAYDIGTLAWAYLKVSLSANEGLAQQAGLVFKLYPLLKKGLEEKSLCKLFEDIEIPLAYVLFRMETEGVAIDTKLLEELSQETQKKIESLIHELYQLAGTEFNLNSPKQLSHVLFEKLKLPVIKKTKTGFSTDEAVLVKLAQRHPLPARILEYRQLTKLKSTYIDALPKLVDPSAGRIHASFNQTGTETGRLSSNNPNLQNIPIRTELGRQIRKAFIPSGKDRLIISADYSQIELRILAHLSEDANLIRAFKEDQDIHVFTAAQIFDVKESQVTREMRDAAKRVNFGLIYGISAFGLAKDLSISQEKAQEFIDKYFLRYPGVKRFMEGEIKKAEKNGFVLTLLNRRRYLPEIKSENMAVRQLAQRQAINTPVQGSAADLIKLAMINIQEELEKESLASRMIITVHDELVFDVAEKEKTVITSLIREHMENPLSLAVPIKVSIKAGKNWMEMQGI